MTAFYCSTCRDSGKEASSPPKKPNRLGLFAGMTRGRYEIEFQGSDDGQTWVVYPFCFKPQDPSKAPGIYAPYQPRFDWNLWFASLSSWRQEPIVVRTEQSLLRGDVDVLLLFAGNPFPHAPPGARRGLAILVHDARRKTFGRNVVAASIPRVVCPYTGAPIRRKNCRDSVTTRLRTERIAHALKTSTRKHKP